jgi:glycosyltransferase involved in cell wall biosynthesis
MNDTIAIVITGLSFGGAERVTTYLANYFAERGRSVHLITLTPGEPAYQLAEAISVTELKQNTGRIALLRYGRLVWSIRQELKRIQPSIVLGMMSFAGSLGAIANLGLKTPFIISERNDPYTSTITTSFEKKIFRWIYRHYTTKAIFQSKAAKSYYFSLEDPRGVVIPNPLFIDQMPKPNKTIVRSHTIVSAGRLNHQKNYPLLITAFKEVHAHYPEYRLVIYGEGDERNALENLVAKLGLNEVVLLPGIERDIFTKLQETEIFVLSSDFEGMPNALLEAMAMGLPCITTDYSRGRGTVITDGENGLIVPIRDSEALVEAMLSLITSDALAERIARAAVAIRTELDASTICERWLDELIATEKMYYEP